MFNPATRLLELDARHHELLEKLDELDRQVETTLEEWIRAQQRENPEGGEVGKNRKTRDKIAA